MVDRYYYDGKDTRRFHARTRYHRPKDMTRKGGWRPTETTDLEIYMKS